MSRVLAREKISAPTWRWIRRLGPSLALPVAIALLATACRMPGNAALPAPPVAASREDPQDVSAGRQEPLRFERLSAEDGLSQSTVNCVLQDSTGFMWFGTNDGLNRFDGYGFEVYRHDPQDPQSPGHNVITSLYEDQEGALWIGTYGGGLDRLDLRSGLWRHYQHDPSDPHSLSENKVRFIYQDRSETLWVATHGGGLNRFDRKTERFTHYGPEPGDPSCLCDWLIDSVLEDSAGELWIGSNSQGLAHLDRSTGRFTHYRHDPDDPRSLSNNVLLTAIVEDLQGALWVATFDGLNRFDPQTGQAVRYHHRPDDPHSLSHNIVNTLYRDRSGALWIGTAGGLDRFDPQTGTFVHYQSEPGDPHSLSGNVVLSIYEDRAGALWIGTMGGGLNRVDNALARFRSAVSDPQDPNSLSHSSVEAIWEDQAGVLWIGTTGGGLNRFDRTTGQWRHFQHDPDNPHSLSDDIVSSIVEDASGALWVGTAAGGLNRLDPTSQQFARYLPNPGDPGHSLSHSAIRALHQDQEGMLWIGTHGDGINLLDPQTGQVTHYRHDADDPYSLGNNWVFAFYEDPEGALWIGTRDAGLDRFDQETEQFTHYRHEPGNPQSLAPGAVQAIHRDRQGMLWIGTDGGGLSKLDREGEVFVHYGAADGLPGRSVFGILEDGQGYLWLSTDNGVSRFDPRTETFRNYDARDGLQNSVFTGGASFRSGSGEMFFGGVNGLSAFYPNRIEDNPYVPPVVLTALTQDGQDLDVGVPVEFVRELTLRRPRGFFEFQFAALNFAQPGKNRYAYMLEGFDTGWNDVGTRRSASYGNLPPGRYTLRIKGSNNDGRWNEGGVSVQVTVVPQWWERGWFWGVAALALAGSVMGGYQLRVRSVKARSRQLERLVEERTSQLEAFYLAEERMHRHLRLDQVLQALVDVAVDVLRADKSAVYVWDGDRGRWVMQIARGFSPQAVEGLTFARQEGSIGRVARSGQAVALEEVLSDAMWEQEAPEAAQIVLAEGIRSYMNLPIQVGGETYGVFQVGFTRPYALDQEAQRLFLTLVQRAQSAIENARLYERAQDLAALEERQRLARDLHDAVTQTLFSTSLIAEVLPRIWEQNPDDGRRRLEQVRRGTRNALAEMRALLLELRPTGLVDADLGDLLRQLGEAVAGRSGVSIAVDVAAACRLPPNVHVALYRIAQEALNNVAKHARASRAWVSLHCSSPAGGDSREKRVVLSIRDNGRGFDPHSAPAGHLGLGIMRERAEAVEAVLTIESEREGGTEVRVFWVKDEKESADEP